MIEAENLGKEFHDKKRGVIRAVETLSFRCAPGHVYGLLGANGAGKTTTLRMLATILAPTAGTASRGRLRYPARARKGSPKHRLSLHGHGALRPADGARDGRILRPSATVWIEPTARRRALALFDRLEIEAFATAAATTLSTGMKQKVSIARTLVHDPPVMIFDEPTSGLDVISAQDHHRLHSRMPRESGKTVLFSTHVMSEAEKLCDTIGIIHDGRLLAEGSLEELRARYGHADLEEIFVRVVDA